MLEVGLRFEDDGAVVVSVYGTGQTRMSGGSARRLARLLDVLGQEAEPHDDSYSDSAGELCENPHESSDAMQGEQRVTYRLTREQIGRAREAAASLLEAQQAALKKAGADQAQADCAGAIPQELTFGALDMGGRSWARLHQAMPTWHSMLPLGVIAADVRGRSRAAGLEIVPWLLGFKGLGPSTVGKFLAAMRWAGYPLEGDGDA